MNLCYLLQFGGCTHLIPVDHVSITVSPLFIHARTDLSKDMKVLELDAFPEIVTVEEGLAALKKLRDKAKG